MSLPEPSFIDRDPQAITAEIVAQYEQLTGKTLYPAQVERLLIDVIAYRETLVRIGIQEAAKQFIAQGGGGKIVNTASIAGKQGYEPLAHYSASKFAVVALTQAAARAFGKHRINVNAICPGVVATDMWKLIDKGFKDEGLTSRDNEAFEGFSADILLGRPSRPEDLAGVSVFLASAGSDYMTGQSLVVDGGMVLL